VTTWTRCDAGVVTIAATAAAVAASVWLHLLLNMLVLQLSTALLAPVNLFMLFRRSVQSRCTLCWLVVCKPRHTSSLSPGPVYHLFSSSPPYNLLFFILFLHCPAAAVEG
jgi:hypothetical protein